MLGEDPDQPGKHDDVVGVVILTRTGEIDFACRSARECLKQCFPPTAYPAQLPKDLRVWMEMTKPAGHVFQVGCNGYYASATMLETEEGTPRCILLRFSWMGPGDELPASGEEVPLTPREGEILSWLGEGKANWTIGKILDVSEDTVRKHLQHIYKKLGVENRTEAACHPLARPRKAGPGGGSPPAGTPPPPAG